MTPGQWPPEQQQQQQMQLPWTAQPPIQKFADWNASYDATTAASWGPAPAYSPPAAPPLPVPVLSLGTTTPPTRVPYTGPTRVPYGARLPGGGVDERERALSVMRRLGDTLDMLEREGDKAGVTSLYAYIVSLESKFKVDFPD